MATFTRKKYLRLAKNFYGRGKNCYRIMIPRVERALVFAYRDRKTKKREYRKEWIQTINSGVREHDVNYSRFIFGLNNSNIDINRKVLANLAIHEPYSFKAIVDEIKVQNNLEKNSETDMEYVEALRRNFLVSEEVFENEPLKDGQVEYMKVREDAEERFKDNVIWHYDEYSGNKDLP